MNLEKSSSDKLKVKKLINDCWLGLGDTDKIQVENALTRVPDEYSHNFSLFLCWYLRQPEHFAFLCKWIFNVNIIPIQQVVLQELYLRPFPMLIASRGFGKTFLFALFSMIRAFLQPGSKIIITGAGFRQSKFIFEYCETIWKNAPILRSIVGEGKGIGPSRDIDRCMVQFLGSTITAIPVGNGDKIRGLRSHVTIVDEFNSIVEEVFQVAIAPFSSVTADPINNVKEKAKEKLFQELGIALEDTAVQFKIKKNQMIIGGTPGYIFQHFYKNYEKHKAIINSRGDRAKLEEVYKGEVPKEMDWRDYSIMRIPFELIPEGFMDANFVAKSKATLDFGTFASEYSACFLKDSSGFYKRSLIEGCTCNNQNPIQLPSCGTVFFESKIRGDKNKQYVYGIDTASERDNFAIVILEVWPDHNRVVYCWTTNRQLFKAKLKKGVVVEQDFYAHCVRKIRDLMKVFPCSRIALDSQGGGIAIEEGLHDMKNCQKGEVPIWQVKNQDEPKDSDNYAGEHILEMVNFAKADYTSKANHNMRKDFEDKVLLFPYFDPVSLELAIEEEGQNLKQVQAASGRDIDDFLRTNDEYKIYDTLEDVILDIEELKNELITIIVTRTEKSGREHWDTPEVKLPNNKKGHLKKDRYTALLMANMSSRTIQRTPEPVDYTLLGGFAQQIGARRVQQSRQLYESGPDEFVKNLTTDCCFAVTRKRR